MPSLVTLIKAADTLKVSVDYLLGVDEREPAMPNLATAKDSRAVTRIINRTRNDPALRHVLLLVLKLFNNRQKDDH